MVRGAPRERSCGQWRLGASGAAPASLQPRFLVQPAALGGAWGKNSGPVIVGGGLAAPEQRVWTGAWARRSSGGETAKYDTNQGRNLQKERKNHRGVLDLCSLGFYTAYVRFPLWRCLGSTKPAPLVNFP